MLLAPAVERVLGRLGKNPERAEDIHTLRVSSRRLRVALWLFRDVVGRRRRGRLDRGLARLAAALGVVREWDVLIDSLAASSRNRTRWTNLRREAQAHARRTQEDRRGRRLRRRLRALRRRIARDPAFAAPLDRDAQELAVERRVQGLQQRLLLAQDGSIVALHRLRLQVKKLRYTLELLGDAGAPPPQWEAALSRLRDAQDILGQWNDRHVSVSRSRVAATPVRTDSISPAEVRRVLRGLHAIPALLPVGADGTWPSAAGRARTAGVASRGSSRRTAR